MTPGPETSSGFRWWFTLGEQIAAWCAVVGLWILVHAVTIIGGRILAGEDVGLSVVALTAGMAGVGACCSWPCGWGCSRCWVRS